MGQKITLIEYNDGTYAGDDLDPDIQYRDCLPCVSGKEKIVDDVVVDIVEVTRRIEDMRNYAYIISSSSSSSLSSSSETPQEELFEHHETGGDSSYTIGQTSYSVKLAQTFTPDIAHEITKVELELFDGQGDGITGDIDVEIKATSGGLPTGAALASGTIDAADLNPAHYSDVYDDVNFSMTEFSFSPYISPNGLHLYNFTVVDSKWYIYHYTLSTAWDITTASLSESVNFKGGAEGYGGFYFCQSYDGIYFKPDGTQFWFIGTNYMSSTQIYRVDCSTAWSVVSPTATYIAEQLMSGLWSTNGLWFSSDGTKLYYVDTYNKKVFQFNMSTAWDVTSTGSSPNQTTDFSAYTSDGGGVCFSSDGKKMILTDNTNAKILFWNLATAWNLSGESKDAYEMDVSDVISAGETHGSTICCKTNGKRFFIANLSVLYEFNLPALHGDWHECVLTGEAELDAATKYAVEASYEDYEVGVSEPEWVNNSDGDDNYDAGSMLRHDGSNWFDS